MLGSLSQCAFCDHCEVKPSCWWQFAGRTVLFAPLCGVAYIDPTADPTQLIREVNVPNTKKLSIRIVKIDKESKVPLEGFTFDVYYNDAHLTSVTTDANSEAMLENL